MLVKKRYVILLAVAFVFIFVRFFFSRHDEYETVQMLAETTVGEITKDIFVEQTFVAEMDNLSAVEIFFGTYNRLNSSNLVVQLIDDNDRLILNEVINTSELKDNQFEEFPFSRIKKSKGRVFSILIKSENASNGNAITVWTSLNDSYINGELFVNMGSTGKDIAFKTMHSINQFDILNQKIDKIPIKKETIVFVFWGLIFCSFMLMYKSLRN